MRESMVKAAKSKENEEGHGSLQIRMRDRENVRGLRTRVCGVAREKKMERKSGADEGCHRIYERKRGTRSMTTAGGHMEVREMPERENQ